MVEGTAVRTLRLSAAVVAGLMIGFLLPDLTWLYRYGIDLASERVIDACAVLAAAVVILAAGRRRVAPDVVLGAASFAAATGALALWAGSLDRDRPLPGPASLVGDVTTITSLHGLKGFLIGLGVWIVACLSSGRRAIPAARPSTARVVMGFALAPTLVAGGVTAEDSFPLISVALVAAAVLSCGVPAYLLVARFARVTFATCAGGAALAGLLFATGMILAVEGPATLSEAIAQDIVLASTGHAFLTGCLFWLLAVADWSGMVGRAGRP